MRLPFFFIWIILVIQLPLGLIQGEAQNNGLFCVNDYRSTISCELSTETEGFNMENASLEFTCCFLSTEIQFLLRNVNDTYRFTLYGDDMVFDEFTKCRVTLHATLYGETKLMEMYSSYAPIHHIKPTPPRNLTVFLSSGHYHFAWDCGYDEDQYLFGCLMSELSFHKNGDQNDSTYLTVDQAYSIKEGYFEADTVYVAKVRTSPINPYKGYQSDWSSTVQWRTEERKAKGEEGLQKPSPFITFGWITCLGCIVSALLILMFFRLTASLKIKTFSKIPTPAPYFQPLYSMYKGNFKNWLLYPSYMGEPFKMDEILKIDTLTEAKPSDNSLLAPPSHLTTCQIPYISHLGKGSAIHDKKTFPESYVLISKKASVLEALSSQSLDQAEPHEDTSDCEDLNSSLASSELERAPSQELWNPVYHDDYCTLADTPNGLFPAIQLTKTHRKPQEVPSPQSSQVDP